MNWLSKVLHNPITTLIGLAIGVAGVWIGLAAIEKPKLTWALGASQSVVTRFGDSKLSVLYGGKPVQSDVTAVQVAVWNDGNRSIRRTDILRPLQVTINSSKVLDATISKVTREVVQASVTPQASETNLIELTWDILEPGDGFVVQVLYGGPVQTTFTAHAVVERQAQLNTGQPSFTKARWLPPIFLSVAALCLVNVTFEARRWWTKRSSLREFVVESGTALFLLGVSLYAVWRMWFVSSPPFPL